MLIARILPRLSVMQATTPEIAGAAQIFHNPHPANRAWHSQTSPIGSSKPSRVSTDPNPPSGRARQGPQSARHNPESPSPKPAKRPTTRDRQNRPGTTKSHTRLQALIAKGAARPQAQPPAEGKLKEPQNREGKRIRQGKCRESTNSDKANTNTRNDQLAPFRRDRRKTDQAHTYRREKETGLHHACRRDTLHV